MEGQGIYGKVEEGVGFGEQEIEFPRVCPRGSAGCLGELSN